MKKTIIISMISSIFLMAGNPIHDLMDNRIKGKSYSGSLDDNQAAEDGLGILPLQHHTGTTEVNNELLVQRVFNKIVKSENDKTKTSNIRTSLTNGIVGTSNDRSIVTNAGVTLVYNPGTLSSCKEIKSIFPSSTDGTYNIKNIGNVYCDMTTDGGGWMAIGTTNNFNYYRVDSGTYNINIVTDSDINIYNQYKNAGLISENKIVTDWEFEIRADDSGHPSQLVYSPISSPTSKTTITINNGGDHTHLELFTDTGYTRYKCVGGGASNTCGQYNKPSNGSYTSNMFIRSFKFDPRGSGAWAYSNQWYRNWFTLRGNKLLYLFR